MPKAAELPTDLKAFARLNAIEVSHIRFGADSERLISAVERILGTVRPQAQQKRENREREEREQKQRAELAHRQGSSSGAEWLTTSGYEEPTYSYEGL